MLQDGSLITGVQQMEEIFNYQTYEISFIVTRDGFENKRHSIRTTTEEISVNFK
jgi:hypothetical protein